MFNFLTRPRLPFFLLALTCFGLLGFGLYLQTTKGVVPCPMCIMQRVALIVVGGIALLAGLHGSTGVARKFYGLLVLVAALIGGGVAANQTWLQLNPPTSSACGADFSYMMDNFAITEWMPMVFKGEGDCSVVDWRFLELSIANWSLVCFCLIVLASLVALFQKTRHSAFR